MRSPFTKLPPKIQCFIEKFYLKTNGIPKGFNLETLKPDRFDLEKVFQFCRETYYCGQAVPLNQCLNTLRCRFINSFFTEVPLRNLNEHFDSSMENESEFMIEFREFLRIWEVTLVKFFERDLDYLTRQVRIFHQIENTNNPVLNRFHEVSRLLDACSTQYGKKHEYLSKEHLDILNMWTQMVEDVTRGCPPTVDAIQYITQQMQEWSDRAIMFVSMVNEAVSNESILDKTR